MGAKKTTKRADHALDGKGRQLVEAHGGGVTVDVDADGDAQGTPGANPQLQGQADGNLDP